MTKFKQLKLPTAASIFSLLAFQSAHADPHRFDPPDHGYVITATTAKVAQKSGTSVTISCSIRSIDSPDNDHGDDEDDVRDLFSRDKLIARAFFPDRNTEVSSSVAFDRRGNCTYVTPPLKSGDANTFILMLTNAPDDSIGLHKIQDRIAIRLAYLTKLINRVKGLPESQLPTMTGLLGIPDMPGAAWSGKKHGYQSNMDSLRAVRDNLQALSDRIDKNLALRGQTLAELRYPLQTDNVVAGPSFLSTIMGQFRISISYSVGAAVDGEQWNVHSVITNLKMDDSAHDLWIPQFQWAGAVVNQMPAQTIPGGTSVAYDYFTPKLEPENVTKFTAGLFKSKDQGKKLGDEWGALSFAEPVADDTVGPTWQSAATPTLGVADVQYMEPVNVTAFDSFGLSCGEPGIISPNIKATLNYIAGPDDGEGNPAPPLVQGDVTSYLKILSPDQGQTCQVQGDLNYIAGPTSPLPEGFYTFTLAGSDTASNVISPNPFTRTFEIDRTPPVLSGLGDGATETSPTFLVMGQANERVNAAWVDGVQLQLSADHRSFFGFYTAEIPGNIHLHWAASDEAGNMGTATTTVFIPSSLINDGTPAVPSPTMGALKMKFGVTNSSSLWSISLDLHETHIVDASGKDTLVNDTPVLVDLVHLLDGTRQLVGNIQLPGGTYSQAKFVLGPNNSVVQNGITYPLALSQAVQRNGFSVNLNNLNLPVARVNSVILAFDLNQTVQQTGSNFTFNPVLALSTSFTPLPAQEQLIQQALGSDADSYAEQADYVVQATAASVGSFTGTLGGNPMIYTQVNLNVSDVLKGSPSAQIPLQLLGGTIPNPNGNGAIAVFVTSVPAVSAGEQMILFLKNSPGGVGIVGGHEGKITVGP